MFPGVDYSEEGRVEPGMSFDFVKSVLEEAFTSKTNAILMTNGASVYVPLEVGKNGICEKYCVQHSEDEFARREEAGPLKILPEYVWYTAPKRPLQ